MGGQALTASGDSGQLLLSNGTAEASVLADVNAVILPTGM